MPSTRANRILAALRRHRRGFEMTQDDLGRRLCKAFTDGVQETIARQQSPDGTPWPPLSPGYAREKSRRYPGSPEGVAAGVMADSEQVAGVIELTKVHAFCTYGVSDQARREAAEFQKVRPFWGFTPESRAAIREVLDGEFRRIMG